MLSQPKMGPHVDTDLKLHKQNVHQIQHFVLVFIYYIYPLIINVRMRENPELHTLEIS